VRGLTMRRHEVAAVGPTADEVAWVGELDAGTTIPLRRPGDNPDRRVVIEEWELLPGDPPSPLDGPPTAVVLPVWERRLVYAGELAL